MIFDVKMEDFVLIARLVSGGHMTETPATTNYANGVYHETVCLELVIAALDGLEIKCRDVINSYITATIKEKVCTTLVPEFGEDTGKWELVVHDLYGLNSSGDNFRPQLGCCMQGLRYDPCISDPDLWTKEDIYKYFTLKYLLIGEPDIYLGANLRKMTKPNDVWCWIMSPSIYI